MFNIYVNDENLKELPDDDICYIIAKDGVYLKKKLGLIESLTPVKNISFLDNIQCHAKMNIPKIPGIIYAQLFDFFKEVYHQHRAEGLAIIYYNSKSKKFKVHIPVQAVNGAAVNVENGYQIHIPNYQPVCSIHSHPGFSAFHSGTDTHDEEDFDGLHITVGEVDSEAHMIVASIASNGYRVQVDPLDYIDGVYLTEYSKYFQHMFRPKFEVVNGSKVYEKEVKTSTGYVIDSYLSSVTCDPKWLLNIEKYNFRKVTYAGYQPKGGGYQYGQYSLIDDYGDGYGYAGYGAEYDSMINAYFGYHNPTEKPKLQIPQHSSASSTPSGKTFNPCYLCNLKFCKTSDEFVSLIKSMGSGKSKIETEEIIIEPVRP